MSSLNLVPFEQLFSETQPIRLGYSSEGARVTHYPTSVGSTQAITLDPHRVAIVRDLDDRWVVLVWGGGGRDSTKHRVQISDYVIKVPAWRAGLMQVQTENGVTVTWARSKQCGSCGGIPAPKGYPWGQVPLEVVPWNAKVD